MKLIIDKEFRTLIPPLSAEEFEQLEANCVENGIQDSLKVWNGILIDGHNRYEIAEKHDLKYKTEEMEFSGRDDIKLWIIKNQLGRRNLDKWSRFDLVKSLEKIEAKKAKERQTSGINQYTDKSLVENLPQPSATKTRDVMGRKVDVSGKTYDKMKTIDESDNEEVKQKARSGEISTDKAYRMVKGLPPKKKMPQTEVIDLDVKTPVDYKAVEEMPVKFDVVCESNEEASDLSNGSAETADLDYAEGVLRNILSIFYTVDDNGIDRICNLDCESFNRRHFKDRLSECIRILVRLENRLL